MKKRLLIIMTLCVLMTLALAISVGAECQAHTYDWTVKLGSEGFLGEISAEAKCAECGAKTSEVIPPIFITRGYSYKEDGGIAQGYGVNREALERYEELSGEKISFGGVLAVREVIGSSNPLDNDGKPISDKVLVKDFTDTKYSVINIMIRDIPESARDSAEVICALYINAGGRTTYVDNRAEKISCGEKTFNEVKASPEADTTLMNKYAIIDGRRYHQMTSEELNFTQGMFWNNSSLQNSAGDTAFNNKFWGTGNKFTPEDLPNGTIIIIDSEEGWQYRPHKWSGNRPNNTKEARVVVDDAWWGSYSYVGFNIGKYDGDGATQSTGNMLDISTYTKAQIEEIFQIYVPVDIATDTTVPEPDPTPDPEPTPDYSEQKQDWDEDGALKILCIGNSFSTDSMEYVYQVAQSAGIENVVLGNLYIGGCSLETHLSNAQNNVGAYTYFTNTTGTWSSPGSRTIKAIVESEDWDFISFQQVSGSSGISSTYSPLAELISIVEPLNPSARLVWHMTWAYQSNSSHADFSKYDKNQMTMYNAIINAVQENIVTNDKLEIIIPAGTAIQNVRTSYIGDTLTRDGYHLSYDYGRLIGSLAFVKALTGVSIDNVTYMPEGVDANELAVAIEAVNNAIATPFAVTNSIYTTKPDDNTGGGDTGEDEGESTITPPEVPEGYIWLDADDMGLVEGAYYQSDANSNWDGLNYATNDFGNGFITTKKFTREELPVGTIIVIADGWQYRPEGWINGARNSSGNRPANITINRVVIDETWWGDWTERAFNVSNVSNTTSSPRPFTEQEKKDFANAIFFIYVPEDPDSYVPEDTTVYISSSDCDEEIVTIEGKQYRALKASVMGYQQRAYYYSTSKGPVIFSSTDSTSADFWATKVFDKEELPIGAVIWVNSGWRYRPEGWVNGAGGNRPDNVTQTYVTADESWWGNWSQRAFNLSKTDGADIGTDTSLTVDDIHANFKIYIPIESIKEVIE